MFAPIVLYITKVWIAFTAFISDMIVFAIDGVLGGVATGIESLPVPAMMDEGADSLLANISSDVVYFLAMSGFDNAMGLISAAISFRILRKFVTFGIW